MIATVRAGNVIGGGDYSLDRLIPEYEGTIENYPGDNSQRSIVGYNYDNKGG